MTLSKTHAVTSIGVVGLLVALGTGACSDKSDGGGSAGSTSDAGKGGSSAGASGKAGSSGKSGSANGGDAGNDRGGEGGDGGAENTAGAATGEGGSAGVDTGSTAGAAGDGTTVCEANTQTDSANCGRCGHSCGSADCVDGLCYAEAVVVPEPTVNELTLSGFNGRTTLNDGNLYAFEKVTDATQDLDLRYRLLRSPTTATIPAAGTIVQDIADDISQGYFVDAVNYDSSYFYQCTTTGGTRVALNASAATPTIIFKSPVAGMDCNAIAIGGTSLFISSHDTVNGKDTLYTIPIASLGPNATPTLVPNIGERDSDIFSLTVIGNNLFWMELNLATSGKDLVTAPVAGLAANGKPTTIAPDLGNESASIAYDANNLYWTDTHGGTGKVLSIPLPYVAGATPKELMTDLDGVRQGIAQDDEYLYVMEANNPDGNMVYRVAKDGSGNDTLGVGFINDQAQHKGLQMTGVDSKYVYFLHFDGIIGRLPVKP